MRRRSLVLSAVWFFSAGGAVAGFLTGPILDLGLRVEIEDVLQLPATAPSAPLARVNVLREAPDGSGRVFVNDLRGPLYVVDGDWDLAGCGVGGYDLGMAEVAIKLT